MTTMFIMVRKWISNYDGDNMPGSSLLSHFAGALKPNLSIKGRHKLWHKSAVITILEFPELKCGSRWTPSRIQRCGLIWKSITQWKVTAKGSISTHFAKSENNVFLLFWFNGYGTNPQTGQEKKWHKFVRDWNTSNQFSNFIANIGWSILNFKMKTY